jgi:mitochondrial chaperone BCS1
MLQELVGTAESLWKSYADMMKANPVVGGAMTLYGMGVATYFFKDIPMRVFAYIRGQFMVGVRINNNDSLFNCITYWLEEQERVFRCKNFAAKLEYGTKMNSVAISVGYGNHIFFYKRRIFYLSRIEKDVNNTTDTKESLYITTYGWSPESIRRFLQDVVPQPSGDANTHIHAYENYWTRSAEKVKRDLSTVVLTDSNEKKLRDHISQYLSDKDWYRAHKIPWRTGIVLEGPPGTGKTTLSLALCGEFDSNLFIANLSMMSDEKLLEMFKSLPPRAIILIEDIDSYSVATSRKRKLMKKKNAKDVGKVATSAMPSTPEDSAEDAKDFSFGSLSGLLNAIDGICSTEDRILIATTNHIEKLDPALIREGRFELILKCDYLNDETARKMFAKFYPGFILPKDFKMKEEISHAKFQTMAMGNKKDPKVLLDFCNKTKEMAHENLNS